MARLVRSAPRVAALGLALAAPALMPAAASAASLTVSTPCVVPSAPKIDFSLAGFAADGLVTLNDNGNFLDAITVGGDGSFVGSFGAQHRTTGLEQHTLTATDTAGNSASGSFSVTELGFIQTPAGPSVKPSSKLTYTFDGFIGGGTLYAHYVFSKSQTQKQLATTVKLGTLQGPCGTLKTGKLTAIPLKKPKVGTYEIQFDTNPAYKRQQGVYLETYLYSPKVKKKKKKK